MRLPRIRLPPSGAMVLVAVAAIPLWIHAKVVEHRAWGERERCRTALANLGTILVAIYRDGHGAFPPGTQKGRNVPPEQRMSWIPPLLPYTDCCQGLCYLFEPDRPWDSPQNLLPTIEYSPVSGPVQVIPSTSPPERSRGLSCPSNHTPAAPGMPEPFHYVGIAGLGVDAPSLPVDHPRGGLRLRSPHAPGGHPRRGFLNDAAG